MTNPITYNVLVLDPDKKFLEALRYALDRDSESLDSQVKLVEVMQESQIKQLDSDAIWNCILIDSSFVNSKTINYLNEELNKNPTCEIVLLISSQNGLKIKETIRSIDSLKVAEGIEFILSDNLADSMKVTQCLAFIKNGLK